MSRRLKPKDLDAYSEVSLALAQATMQQAIDSSGLDRGTVAKRFCDSPRRRWATGHLDRLLSGDCDLTLRDMGRLLAICGFEVRFNRIPRIKLDSTKREKARMLRSSTYGLQDRPSCAPKPDADMVLSDRRVLAALEKHAEIQADFDDFDGDRRGISQHLWDAKVEIVESVSHALQHCPSGQERKGCGNLVPRVKIDQPRKKPQTVAEKEAALNKWINQILRPMMIQQRKLKHKRSSGPSRKTGEGSPELARDLRTLRNLGGNQQKAGR